MFDFVRFFAKRFVPATRFRSRFAFHPRYGRCTRLPACILDFQHVLVQPFQVCGHHDLAADNAGLIDAGFVLSLRHLFRCHLLANAAIAASRVSAYPCVGMLCLPDSAGQVFRPRPWCGQRDSSVKEGGSKYESNIVPGPAIREAIDSDVQKEASKQGKQ
jgi:hypothetical protein